MSRYKIVIIIRIHLEMDDGKRRIDAIETKWFLLIARLFLFFIPDLKLADIVDAVHIRTGWYEPYTKDPVVCALSHIGDRMSRRFSIGFFLISILFVSWIRFGLNDCSSFTSIFCFFYFEA